MRIAYLVLCHADPSHIERLSRKLTSDNTHSYVFIHVDAKADIHGFRESLQGLERVRLLDDRLPVWWAGVSSVKATLLLIKAAASLMDFDRFVLLQGADYPLKSNDAIHDFFQNHEGVEFIRACNATLGRTKYIYSKARYYLFFDRPNLVKKVANKITRLLDLRFQPASITSCGANYDIYWGCAQWALTRACIEHILAVEDEFALCKEFDHRFPADELYFHTIVHNSKFGARTIYGGYESEKTDLVQLINLCYFEYLPGHVKIFDIGDFEALQKLDYLFIRKVATDKSTTLLDEIDKIGRQGFGEQG